MRRADLFNKKREFNTLLEKFKDDISSRETAIHSLNKFEARLSDEERRFRRIWADLLQMTMKSHYEALEQLENYMENEGLK